MKRLIITSLVLGMAFLGLQASASANLLEDPSFEDYSGAWVGLGWDDEPWYAGGGNGIPNNFAIGGGGGITNQHANSELRSALLYQYGDADDGVTWSYAVVGQKNITEQIYGNTTYTASAFAKRLGDISGAQGYIKVTWLNSVGALISDESGASQLTNSAPLNTWIALSDNFTSPETAAKANFDILFDRDSTLTGDPADVIFDTTHFDVIPEPATMLLFGSGLIGLLGFSRRKRS